MTPTDPGQLKEELRHYVNELKVIEKLQAYNAVPPDISRSGSDYEYCVIVLDEANNKVEIYSYGPADFEHAYADYSAIEKEAADGKSLDAVFVTGNSLRQLKRAYPNYFLDTNRFLKIVKDLI